MISHIIRQLGHHFPWSRLFHASGPVVGCRVATTISFAHDSLYIPGPRYELTHTVGAQITRNLYRIVLCAARDNSRLNSPRVCTVEYAGTRGTLDGRTELTGVSGTRIEVVPNLPKCRDRTDPTKKNVNTCQIMQIILVRVSPGSMSWIIQDRE